MKKTLGIAVILAVTATASATVRLFVTTSSDPYGLTIPSNHNVPTYSTVDPQGNTVNPYDYYYRHFVVAAFPPIDAASGTEAEPVEILGGDWAYIWLQFRDEPKGGMINGLRIQITGPSGFFPTYYVQNDLGGAPCRKRWDGTATAPLYPEWHNNPQTLVAITASGLVAVGDDPQMMSHYQSTNPRRKVALLGAIDLTVGGLYHIDMLDCHYATPPNPWDLIGGVFHYTPEPASALLLGLVSLLIRRR